MESTAKPAIELWPRLEAYTNLPSFEISISAQVFLLPSNPAGNVLAVEGLELAGRTVERIRRDAVALFIIAIHNGQLRVKGKMAWFQALGRRPGTDRFAELARLGIKPKLIHRVRASVRKGNRLEASGRWHARTGPFRSGSGILDHRAIPADGIAAYYTATVAGPAACARTIGGHVGGIGADFRDTQGHERFPAVINAKGRHAGRAHQTYNVAIRATHCDPRARHVARGRPFR